MSSPPLIHPATHFAMNSIQHTKRIAHQHRDDLVIQIHRILQLLDAFGILTLGKPELEADDIIASVTQAVLDDPAAENVDVSIISRDKDLEQLLGDRVTMLDLHKDKILDVQGLWETKGIEPSQVVDVLALMGDTSDNVPGVEKVGLKTAAQLIQQYGSIDGIFDNIDEIKGKRRENLEKAHSQLPLSKRLVTLVRDADLDFSIEQARVKPLRSPEDSATRTGIGTQDVVKRSSGN